MGLTKVTVMVSNLEKSKPGYEESFLVDTESIDCMAPMSELANGEPVEYEYGFARISFLGSETVSQIIFRPDNAEPILGVVALENVGIAVDPVSRELKRMTAKSLK